MHTYGQVFIIFNKLSVFFFHSHQRTSFAIKGQPEILSVYNSAHGKDVLKRIGFKTWNSKFNEIKNHLKTSSFKKSS